MYKQEQIRRARIEIENSLNNLNMILFQRTDIAPYREREEVDLQDASEEIEKLRDLLAFL